MGLELSKRARNLALGAGGVSALLFLSGCSAEGKNEIERLAMPAPATAEGQPIFELWNWAWLAAMITGVIVWGLIFWVVFAYRRRSETEIPVQTRYNLPLEIFYTIAPIMMVIVFFFFTVDAQNKSLYVDEDAPYKVTVLGQKWSWTFNYLDAADGETVYEAGTTENPPTLYLVEDQKVTFNLASPDVIHSFWVPDFLFKMDVVPGRQDDNKFTLTPDRKGEFEGRCAELCGYLHSKMLFKVKVVSESEYKAKMAELKAAGSTGLNLGSEDAYVQDGLESDETTGGHE